MKKLRKRHSGEGYIDVCVLVVCAMLVLALAVRILPVFVAKQQLDTYAVELVREAEISGRVGTETNRRAAALTDSTGLDPNIRWSKTGRIQLNEEVTVTLTLDMDIGLFGGFGSFPITLRSEATGKSEVYADNQKVNCKPYGISHCVRKSMLNRSHICHDCLSKVRQIVL